MSDPNHDYLVEVDGVRVHCATPEAALLFVQAWSAARRESSPKRRDPGPDRSKQLLGILRAVAVVAPREMTGREAWKAGEIKSANEMRDAFAQLAVKLGAVGIDRDSVIVKRETSQGSRYRAGARIREGIEAIESEIAMQR